MLYDPIAVLTSDPCPRGLQAIFILAHTCRHHGRDVRVAAFRGKTTAYLRMIRDVNTHLARQLQWRSFRVHSITRLFTWGKRCLPSKCVDCWKKFRYDRHVLRSFKLRRKDEIESEPVSPTLTRASHDAASPNMNKMRCNPQSVCDFGPQPKPACMP